jgi:hypothetical protein
MSFFSENEIYSIDDIAVEYSLNHDNPLLFTLYLDKNRELDQDEVDYIKSHIAKLTKKINRINAINLKHMDKHLEEKKD